MRDQANDKNESKRVCSGFYFIYKIFVCSEMCLRLFGTIFCLIFYREYTTTYLRIQLSDCRRPCMCNVLVQHASAPCDSSVSTFASKDRKLQNHSHTVRSKGLSISKSLNKEHFVISTLKAC